VRELPFRKELDVSACQTGYVYSRDSGCDGWIFRAAAKAIGLLRQMHVSLVYGRPSNRAQRRSHL
jgi:hypothetical protein